MRKEATLEQWRELYYHTNYLKKIKPYLYFSELNLITILMPKVEEPYYCSIMGASGKPFGIAIYSGFEAIQGFFKVIESEDIPESQLIRYEDCIVAYFGDKIDLLEEEVQLLKDIDLKYEGTNDWVYFRTVTKGYAPFMLSGEEVVRVTELIKQLNLAILEYIEKIKSINFNEGNTLFRWYNEEKFKWETFSAPLFLGDKVYNNIILNDKEVLHKLIHKDRVNMELELDIIYLESVIKDEEFDRPIIPRLCLLADHKTGEIVDQGILTPKEDDIQELLAILINYMKQIGRPRIIFVRDDFTKSVIRYLCKKLSIEVTVKEKLTSIDSICNGLFTEGY